jgi:hypothetical protein
MAQPAKISLLLCLWLHLAWAQEDRLAWYEPAPVLQRGRLTGLVASEVALTGLSYWALHDLWYSQAPQTDFHFFDDNHTWLQIDKVGHGLSAYHIGLFNAAALEWTGLSSRKAHLWGGLSGFVYLSGIELMDGYAAQYGFSRGDIWANFSGSALLVGQELLWGEQRLIPRFSYQPTPYRQFNPGLLGQNQLEGVLKDYNGQTYWLSADMAALTGWQAWPEWLHLAAGYGGTGMLFNRMPNNINAQYPGIVFQRQFYLAPDLYLPAFKPEKPFWRALFKASRFIKIPAPALSYSSSGGLRWHWLFF